MGEATDMNTGRTLNFLYLQSPVLQAAQAPLLCLSLSFHSSLIVTSNCSPPFTTVPTLAFPFLLLFLSLLFPSFLLLFYCHKDDAEQLPPPFWSLFHLPAVPEAAIVRAGDCTFTRGSCGWTNLTSDRDFTWTLASTLRRPLNMHDHTYGSPGKSDHTSHTS